MKVNWALFKKRIPHQVQLKPKKTHEVLWIDDFKDGATLGEMRPHTGQIIIKSGQSNKETVSTYLHELLHAVSDLYDVGLTENQVLKLEKALYYILKPGNIFKDL